MKWIITLLLAFGICVPTAIWGQTPVANPKKKKDLKDADDPPPIKQEASDMSPSAVSDTSPPALRTNTPKAGGLLPIGLVRNTVEGLKIGSQGYVAVTTVKVDAHRKCWLYPYSLFSAQKGVDKTVLVRRDSVGYHMVVEDDTHKWEAEDFDQGSVKYISVQTITAK